MLLHQSIMVCSAQYFVNFVKAARYLVVATAISNLRFEVRIISSRSENYLEIKIDN